MLARVLVTAGLLGVCRAGAGDNTLIRALDLEGDLVEIGGYSALPAEFTGCAHLSFERFSELGAISRNLRNLSVVEAYDGKLGEALSVFVDETPREGSGGEKFGCFDDRDVVAATGLLHDAVYAGAVGDATVLTATATDNAGRELPLVIISGTYLDTLVYARPEPFLRSEGDSYAVPADFQDFVRYAVEAAVAGHLDGASIAAGLTFPARRCPGLSNARPARCEGSLRGRRRLASAPPEA